MKNLFFKLITLAIALLALAQNASAQWNGAAPADPIFPSILNAKVGIGTNAPTQKLQIKGGNALLDYANGTSSGNLYFGGVTTSVNGMRLSFANPTSNRNGYIDVRTTGSTTTNDGLLFRVDGLNGGTERMRICANTGNVGIGIPTPSQKLHVASGIMISGPNPGFGGPMLLFSDNVANNLYPNGRWGIEYSSSKPNNHGLNFWRPWNPSTGGGENWLLFLKDNGMIGMGVDPDDPNHPNPFPLGYRLYVKGGILTERLKIANYNSAQWADYVFAPDYKLKPLAEVEAFVKANKHLPNVPSAQDIERDGLDVADMLSRQMEKIEELMLHTIELNKRMEKIEAENTVLKQSIVNIQNQQK